MWVGMPTAVVVGALVALVIGLPALRLRGLYLGIVTLVFGIAMEYSVLPGAWLSGGGGSAGFPLPRRTWGSHLLTDCQVDSGIYLAICLVLLVAVCVVDDNVVRTRLGRAMRALKENEAVGRGARRRRHALQTARLRDLGRVAGLAGAMNGHATYSVSSESYTFLLSLQLLTIVVVGGLGHRRAVVTTALAFTLLPERSVRSQGYQYAIGAALLLITVTYNPNGIGEFPTLMPRRRSRVGKRSETESRMTTTNPPLPQFGMPDVRAARAVRPGQPARGLGRHRAVRWAHRSRPREPRRTPRKDRRTDRAERRRQEHAVQRGVRPGALRVRHRRFDGQEIHQLRADQRARRGIARGFQHVGLTQDMTVFENLLLAQHQLAVYGDTAAL